MVHATGINTRTPYADNLRLHRGWREGYLPSSVIKPTSPVVGLPVFSIKPPTNVIDIDARQDSQEILFIGVNYETMLLNYSQNDWSNYTIQEILHCIIRSQQYHDRNI